MKILRFCELRELTGLSRSTVWRLERARLFPARRRLSRSAVGWLAEEVDEWIASRDCVDEADSSTPFGTDAPERTP